MPLLSFFRLSFLPVVQSFLNIVDQSFIHSFFFSCLDLIDLIDLIDLTKPIDIMAPTRYTQGHQVTQGPAGDGHALAARDSDSVVQGYGTSSYDDGLYHPSSYQAGEKGQKEADDGSYSSGKKDSTTRQDSSLHTAEQASQGSQQASGYQQGQQNTGSQSSGSQSSGSQYSGSQYGSSQNTGSQNTGTYSGSQYGGSQNTNTNSQNSDSHSSGSQSSGSQSGSHNTGSHQGNSNAQNAGKQQSQQEASNSGYSHSGQGVPGQQQASSDTANTNGQQQSSWSQQNGQDSHSEPSQQGQTSQQNPSNANHEQSSYSKNQAAKSSHEQQDNAAYLSSSHVSDEHQANKAQENESHNLVNNHGASAASVQTAQQPTPTLPTVTTVTMHPTSSLTTSAATTASTHTTLPSTSSTSSATSSPTPAVAKDSDDASYHKATGALAGLLGVALVAGFVIFWIARRKRQQKREANRSRMVQDAFRQPHVDTKQRSSQFYTNFLGTAVGTGASALGAVRRSLALPKFNHHHQQSEKEPMPEQGHIHHPCDDGIYVRGCDVEESSGHDSDRNDSIAAEKAAINESTPTLVVSPSESMARDQTPTVRRVISGRPQMESSESVEPKSGLSHNTQEGEAESSDKAQETRPSTPSPPPDNGVPDNAAQENGPPPRNGNGQNLLAITSMVPSSSSIYRVEIAFQPKKVGQLDLREGQSIIIRQSFDDGWVSSFPP